MWNRVDYRPLEGFVYAITPFNFTAIAGNLPTAPALMGNTVVWKPSPTQQFAAHWTMRLLEAAGLPAGVINLVTGDGIDVSKAALTHPDLAGIHFTGSTKTFQSLWGTVGTNIAVVQDLPAAGRRDRRQGLHPGAPVGRPGGAEDRDGPRRVRVPGPEVLRRVAARTSPARCGTGSATTSSPRPTSLTMGDVADLSNFIGAVIDDRAFAKHKAALDRARQTDAIEVVAGGTYDDSEGYFVRPTLLVSDDPTDEIFTTEYFGPILGVHVYDDADYDNVMQQMEHVGAVRADRCGHRAGPARGRRGRASYLRFAAGQLLRQRQADRRGRRAAAVRWCAGVAAPTTRPARCGT